MTDTPSQNVTRKRGRQQIVINVPCRLSIMGTLLREVIKIRQVGQGFTTSHFLDAE